MAAQGRTGLWIAGVCAAVVLTSIGYGMGRRAVLRSLGNTGGLTPAGAPLPTIQIEPVQPQEELAAISAAETRPAAQTESTPGTAPAAQTPVSNPPAEESTRVREIQLALKAAGFDPGTADGRLGPRTRAAVHDFQLAHGLQADGKVGPRTWSKLEPYLDKSKQPGLVATAD